MDNQINANEWYSQSVSQKYSSIFFSNFITFDPWYQLIGKLRNLLCIYTSTSSTKSCIFWCLEVTRPWWVNFFGTTSKIIPECHEFITAAFHSVLAHLEWVTNCGFPLFQVVFLAVCMSRILLPLPPQELPKQTVHNSSQVCWASAHERRITSSSHLTGGPRNQGPISILRLLPKYRIPILKIRRSLDLLIFVIGIPILVRWHLYIATALGCETCFSTWFTMFSSCTS